MRKCYTKKGCKIHVQDSALVYQLYAPWKK